MLQQIFNITLNSDLNKSKKYQRPSEFKKSRYHTKPGEQDTACFSAASQFLSKLNWQITKLSFEDKEEFLISFSTGEFDFTVKFNLQEYLVINKVQIEVVKNSEDDKKVSVNCSVPFNILWPDASAEQLRFESLSILFSRILYLADDNSFKTVNEGFYEDLMEGLNKELGTLCSLVITFAEKVTEFELWSNLKGILNLNFTDKITVYNVKIR